MHFKEIFRRHITSLTLQKAIWKYKVGEPCSRGIIIYIDLGNGARVKNRLFVCHDRAPDRCSDCVPTQKKRRIPAGLGGPNCKASLADGNE
jgi:hypothetical protein